MKTKRIVFRPSVLMQAAVDEINATVENQSLLNHIEAENYRICAYSGIGSGEKKGERHAWLKKKYQTILVVLTRVNCGLDGWT